MKSITLKITNYNTKKKYSFTVSESTFIIINKEQVSLEPNIATVEEKEDILVLRLNSMSVTLCNLNRLGGFQYNQSLISSDLLYKNFNTDYEKVFVKDQFLIDGDLYYIKALNVKNTFKLNSVGSTGKGLFGG